MNQMKTKAIRSLSVTIRRSYSQPLEKLMTLILKLSAEKAVNAAPKLKSGEWAKLKELRISNFKTIKNAIIPLGDVTILVGPNSSGKSSVLQASHWAARAASYITPKNTKEVISFDRLDYLPSSRPLATAHFGELGSGAGQSHTAVSFVHKSFDGSSSAIATVKIWAARNRGAISAHIDGGGAVTPFKQRNRPITAYIPGLAGLSERETILAQPLMRRHAASGDAGGVLRNVLYNLATRQGTDTAFEPEMRLKRLNELVAKVHPNFNFYVSFDEREDIHINATYTYTYLNAEAKAESGAGTEAGAEEKAEVNRNGKTVSSALPLEGLATGILQVIQIFSYLILFRPRLLLVDEPDAHLHPDKQERLIEVLESAAKEFGTQIVITTHSQHIVRSAAAETQLVWMRNGEVVSNDDNSIRTLMGWGCLDKSVLFFVEDEDDQAIRSILRQWPTLNRQISICRCFGVDNLPRQSLLRGLTVEGEIQLNLVLHRDRDFMTEDEGRLWMSQYKDSHPWITKFVDVEAYFCQPEYLSALYQIPHSVAAAWIKEAASSINGAKKLFKDKREVVRRMLYPDGGSPNSEEMWAGLGEQTPLTVLGKSLHKALKVIAKKEGRDEHLLSQYVIPDGFEIAEDLHIVLQRAIQKNRQT